MFDSSSLTKPKTIFQFVLCVVTGFSSVSSLYTGKLHFGQCVKVLLCSLLLSSSFGYRPDRNLNFDSEPIVAAPHFSS